MKFLEGRMRRLSVLVAAVLTAAHPAGAQAAGAGRIPTFESPTWSAAEPFTSIWSVRELSDGRVLVSDFTEKVIRLIDARGKTLKNLGRAGAGPGEFRAPTRLLALPADTTLVVDRELLRWLVIEPSGALGRVITFPFPKEGGYPLTTALGFDRAGRLIYQKSAMQHAPGEPATALMAMRLDGAQPESLWAVMLQPAEQSKPDSKTFVTRMVVYAPQDDWAVAPDGALGVVRASPYRVEWRLPSGVVVRGPIQKAEQLPVSDKERRDWPGFTIRDVKPPFAAGTARADPFGRLWIRHYVPADATTSRWSVFDRAGNLVKSLSLPRTITIVHLTARGAYVARKDQDDVPSLEFHAWGAGRVR